MIVYHKKYIDLLVTGVNDCLYFVRYAENVTMRGDGRMAEATFTDNKNLGQETQTHDEDTKPQAQSNTAMAVLCYLGILLFIPLLTDAKQDKFVKYHLSQGMVLLIAAVLVSMVRWILPTGITGGLGGLFFGLFVTFIISVIQLGLLVLVIMGIIHAVQGEKKPLPLLGQYASNFKF